MSTTPAFVSRLVRLPLTDADGDPVGRIRDVVLVPSGDQFRVLGLVANIERRNIFINMSRIAEIDPSGVRMVGGTVSVRSFTRRPGEQLAVGDLLDTRIGDEYLTDLAIAPGPDKAFWFVVLAALGRRGPLRRRAPNVVPWEQVAQHFASTPEMDEVAELRDLHPTDVVDRLQRLSVARRHQVVALLADEQVADLLEEMEEEEAVRLVETLDLERAAHILEEMEPDDAADLLADLPETERTALLAEMRPEDSIPLRRLLAYDEDTAGGLMTPEPVILAHNTTVAEALASRVEGRLGAIGTTVLLTRGSHQELEGQLDERDRAAFCNATGADLVVSLHVGVADSQAAQGLATFYYGGDSYGASSSLGERAAVLVHEEILARTDLVLPVVREFLLRQLRAGGE